MFTMSMEYALAVSPLVWKAHPTNKIGTRERVQRNAYAFLVAMVMTGGRNVCPACDRPVCLATGAVQRDRTIGGMRDANGYELYPAGFVVTVCAVCNQKRSALQSAGMDWNGAEQYARDVYDASALVDIPSPREAREWWDSRTPATDIYVPKYA